MIEPARDTRRRSVCSAGRRAGLIEVGSVMGDLPRNAQTIPLVEEYRTLLAVSEAIVSHRDLGTLLHDLAGRLHLVVRFDYLALIPHDAASDTMRPHIRLVAGGTPAPT